MYGDMYVGVSVISYYPYQDTDQRLTWVPTFAKSYPTFPDSIEVPNYRPRLDH